MALVGKAIDKVEKKANEINRYNNSFIGGNINVDSNLESKKIGTNLASGVGHLTVEKPAVETLDLSLQIEGNKKLDATDISDMNLPNPSTVAKVNDNLNSFDEQSKMGSRDMSPSHKTVLEENLNYYARPEEYEKMGIEKQEAARMQERLQQYRGLLEEANNSYKKVIGTILMNQGITNQTEGSHGEQKLDYKKLELLLPNLKEQKEGSLIFELPEDLEVKYEDERFLIKNAQNGNIYTFQDGLCTSIELPNGLSALISYSPSSLPIDINIQNKNQAMNPIRESYI